MSELIKELEKKLEEAKRRESKDAWDKWEKEGEDFLESIKGKCFGYTNSQRYMMLFKVIDYKKQGVWGGFAKYFKIESEGYFAVHETTTKVSCKAGETPYGTFAVITKKKDKTIYPELHYKPQNLSESCCVSENRITILGSYDKNEKQYEHLKHSFPQRSIKDEFFNSRIYKVPVEVYNEAKELAMENAIRTKEFWEKHALAFKALQHV